MLAGLAAIFMAMCMAECISMFPRAGGPYVFNTAAFGMFVGVILGWSLWVSEWAAVATFPISFMQYMDPLLRTYGIPDSWILDIVIKTLFIGSIMLVQYVGVKETGLLHEILTFEKMILVVFILMLIPLFRVDNIQPFAPKGYDELGLATVRIFWAYMGFELVTMPAEEFRNPQRDIPRSIILGISVIMGIYVVTNFVMMGAIPWQSLAASTTPLADAASIALGSAAGLAIAVAGLMSIANSETGTFLGTSRLAFAMGRDGFLPKIFTKIHPTHRTPYASILIQGIMAIIASSTLTLSQLIFFSSFTVLIAYSSICIATIVLRFKLRDVHRPFKVPFSIPMGGAEVPIPAVIGAVSGFAILIQTPFWEMVGGLATLAVGAAVYVFVMHQEGIGFSWTGMQLVTLRTLESEGGWLDLHQVAAGVYETKTVADWQTRAVEGHLQKLGSKKLIFAKNGLWHYRPKLKTKELTVLRLLKERDFRPMNTKRLVRELASRGISQRDVFKAIDKLLAERVLKVGKFGRYELAEELFKEVV